MSNFRKLAASLAAVSALTIASAAWAAPINSPVPTNAYITFDGYDWAWASPCSPGGCRFVPGSALDLSYQGTQGWRLPTLAELQAGPSPTDFFFSGGNVPNGGTSIEGTTFTFGPPSSDGACATAYFTNAVDNQCNYRDATLGAIYGLPNLNPNDFAENFDTWLIRDIREVTNVPEPLTLSLFCIGLAGTVAARRQKKSA